jgi:hypothetical protein
VEHQNSLMFGDRLRLPVRSVGELQGSFDDVTSFVNQHDGRPGVSLDQSSGEFHRFGLAHASRMRLLFVLANHFPILQFPVRRNADNERFLHDFNFTRGTQSDIGPAAERTGAGTGKPDSENIGEWLVIFRDKMFANLRAPPAS